MSKRLIVIEATISLIIMIFIESCNKTLSRNIRDLDNKQYHLLDEYLRKKSLVGLGEYTHGDGHLFEIKTDIIQHLHENLGFEAVLMESDFISTEKTLEAIQKLGSHEAANIGIQSTWADSHEFLSLIDYLQETAKKGDTLFFHGFDSQITGKLGLESHLEEVKKLKHLISNSQLRSLEKAIKISNSRNTNVISLNDLKEIRNIILGFNNQLQHQLKDRSSQWLKNIVGNLNQLILLKEAPKITPNNITEIFDHPKYLQSGSIRDSLMEDNIKFYLKKYNKVIIWAANKHLQYKSSERTWMGNLLKNSYGKDYYAILVVYDFGNWSYPSGDTSGEIPQAQEGTLTYKIAKATDSDVAFIDVGTLNLPVQKIRNNNFITSDSINIKDYCDAILFVRSATGSTYVKDERVNDPRRSN